jgi:AraC family L-rhamnose operon regulatory protein RhaS
MEERILCGHWDTARRERRLPAHQNPGLELVWVANGEVTWDYGGRPVRVPPGHISFSWPWQPHGAYRERVALVELYWIILPLASGMRRVRTPRMHPHLAPLAEAVHPIRFLDALRSMEEPILPARTAVGRAFKEAVRALEAEGGRPGPRAWGWLILLFAELQEAWERSTGQGRDEDAERVRSFLKEIEGRLSEPWTLELMGEACGMGRTRFAAAVKKVFGDTPMRTLNRLRVEAAVRRIRQGEASIAEIADATGFASSRYFATVCKRLTGKAPSQYRPRSE